MLPSNLEGDLGTAPDTCRRYGTRYEPIRRDARLAWWESRHEAKSGERGAEALADREPRSQFALLLDISHTGASIALDRLPTPGEGVWLQLDGDGASDWTEAEVVGVTTTSRGPHLVRLAFRAPCSFEALRTAVCG